MAVMWKSLLGKVAVHKVPQPAESFHLPLSALPAPDHPQFLLPFASLRDHEGFFVLLLVTATILSVLPSIGPSSVILDRCRGCAQTSASSSPRLDLSPSPPSWRWAGDDGVSRD